MISVLMSVYSKENPIFLENAINSILNQSLKPDQFVLVKDGLLTDELNKVIDKFKSNKIFTIVGYNENKGLGFALNYGIKYCNGNIIARMDSDDISDKFRFEKQFNYLTSHPEIKIIGTNCVEFSENIKNIISLRNMPEYDTQIRKYSHLRNPFIHPSIMTYKETIINAGNYQNCYLCEDYDLWIRILNNPLNKSYNLQDYLVYMRVNDKFYNRRGGIKYCRAIVSFKFKMYKFKYINFFEFLKTAFATICISLMPGFIRSFIYKKFLRNKK